MLDNHSRIAAIVHIVLGFLSLLLLACLGIFFRALAEIVRDVPAVFEFIAGAGIIILGVLVALCLLQIGSAIAFLKGARAARTPLIIFSFIALFNVPVGTVAGGYSLWALLRK
ncbi:hypothetical protein [Duganella sp. Root1480D1]|uniref:hypothetical protein n=1 Tax=Duganella sp. Root1480D1 TaxID=1736471 RepID=UPI00070E8993|nr:hypothetical protein [Duganella sp. Root1480D1]KQZ39758.1 hypothetical protein ASD58_05025 [Duganella sp. Root1480D1]